MNFEKPKEEQLTAEACKRLIENSIICWNYMYLTKKICNLKSESKKQKLINRIKQSSIVAWRHINMLGEYDFSEEALKDAIEFKILELLELEFA